jgi:hypothetical protein
MLTSPSSSLSLHHPRRQNLVDSLLIDLHQIRDELRHSLIRDHRVSVCVLGELDVSKPESKKDQFIAISPRGKTKREIVPKNHRQTTEDLLLLVCRETNDVHRLERLGKVLLVVDRRDVETARLGSVDVALRSLDAEVLYSWNSTPPRQISFG